MQAAPLLHSRVTVQNPREEGHDVFLGGLYKEAKSVFSEKFVVSDLYCQLPFLLCRSQTSEALTLSTSSSLPKCFLLWSLYAPSSLYPSRRVFVGVVDNVRENIEPVSGLYIARPSYPCKVFIADCEWIEETTCL